MRKLIFMFLLSLSVIPSYGQASGSCGATPGKLSGTVQDILLNESTPDPIYAVTPSPIISIPQQGFLVVLHDSLAYDSLGGTIINTNDDGIIVPNTLGLEVGDSFSLVSFSYDLEQIKLYTNGLLKNGNSFTGSCCSVVEQQFPDLEFCSALNSIGITDSSQINSLEDVLKVISVYTYGSVQAMSIKGLNNNLVSINSGMSIFSVVGCTNNVTEICFAFDSLTSSHDHYNVSAPCTVNIPDANFKAYLVGNTAINTNGDTEIQCSEASAFNGSISCHSQSISNLTGIEAFSGITELWCHNNSISNIDVSNNINLTALSCGVNSISSLDISNNLNLTQLYCATNSLTNLSLLTNTNLTNVNCSNNFITSLDVSNNINLTSLECNDNSINNIDVSNHPNIIRVVCSNNALDNLNVANGNNTNVIGFSATGNPSLTCIQVDDATYSTTNWTNVDTTTSFSVNCSEPNSVFGTYDQSLSIFPNPATSIIYTEVGTLEILDALGNQVLSTESTGQVDVSSLESGIYFATQNGKKTKLIIE